MNVDVLIVNAIVVLVVVINPQIAHVVINVNVQNANVKTIVNVLIANVTRNVPVKNVNAMIVNVIQNVNVLTANVLIANVIHHRVKVMIANAVVVVMMASQLIALVKLPLPSHTSNNKRK
jgi:hypothetical protein